MFYEKSKRIIDIAVALFSLTFLSPLYLLIAFLVKKEDGGKAIYWHDRVGFQGQLFRLYKFRSMVENADELLSIEPRLYEQIRSGTHKMANDPRVTKIGRFIRKYSLDELLQFYNVVRGEMSFVGPRAIQPDELEKYKREHPENGQELRLILSVKPGITGLWQVSARSTVSFDQRIIIEAGYVKKRSLLLDFWIMLRTPLAVLQAKGAA